MLILIATGIYPPDIGGPAQYAKNTEEQFRAMGHTVKIITYGFEKKLPPGFRHFWFFLRVLWHLPGVDFLFILDTFSVALPSVVAGFLTGKKTIIRTGGDFLWESYVESTGDLVKFPDFYKTRLNRLAIKYKIVFYLTRWILQHAGAMVFSTEWQRDVFTSAYKLNPKKNYTVENFYGHKLSSFSPSEKNFITGSRPLALKNSRRLAEVFKRDAIVDAKLIYDNRPGHHREFIERIQHCYAVALVSIGDISPNMILEAIQCNKPFILTRECGLYEKLKDVGIFVDPESVDDIAQKLFFLSDEKNYELYKRKVEAFTFTHSWRQICEELITIYKKL